MVNVSNFDRIRDQPVRAPQVLLFRQFSGQDPFF